ncbi:MAG: site-specific integrase [Prevotella sp.]|nr:site-specific integrase [Prevotella sp.]
MTISHEPVRLRQRKTRTGLTTLYLDIYVHGRRTYEYLRLYLVPEKTREDKRKNADTMRLAEAVRAKRLVEVQNGKFGFDTPDAGGVSFFKYYEVLCAEHASRQNTYHTWLFALRYLRAYAGGSDVMFAAIDRVWVEGFREYLCRQALSSNSRWLIFSHFTACIHRAVSDNIIQTDPLKGVSGFKWRDTTRTFLTIDEVRLLAQTPCRNDVVRRMFLFSCLTGLRWSDIRALTWSEVQRHGEYTRLVFKQKKTGGLEYLDITPQAAALLGGYAAGTALVFPSISDVALANYYLKLWVRAAGIEKKVSFHCGRHTFAVMMLDLGTDIYTVSKLLGHRNLATTQIYAKVLDKNKQAAVMRIPKIFEGGE